MNWIVNLGWDEESLEIDFPLPVRWNYTQCPHLLIVGKTGSGKTYASQQILARIGKTIPDSQIYLLDYKADDFKFAQGCSRYYAFTACTDGLDAFYNSFETRQRGLDPSRSFRLLFFDEWAAYCQILEKKQAEAEQRKLATLLALGRSYNVHICIALQRPDAQYFSAARDNFSAILGLGNLSAESKQMLFDKEHREQMKPDRRRGTGYFYSDTTGLCRIAIPAVNNYDKMQQYIKQAVDRE